MPFDATAVDWLGLIGSLALIVPPFRMEAAKLRILFEQRKKADPAVLRPLRQDLVSCMKASRDDWKAVDSLCLFIGGGLLALSFLNNGWT